MVNPTPMRTPTPLRLCALAPLSLLAAPQSIHAQASSPATPHVVQLDGHAGGKRFDGIGIVNGGGGTSVLLKDYPEPQRGQILDLVFKPKFGASVSTLLVEIPGDGNSTQGSMPSHMRTRDDLDYTRGYTWWVLREAKARNPQLSLDGAAWSAPGWIGGGDFWSQDAADYYVKWLEGLRDVYGLEFDAIGCRNEKGVSFSFVKRFRETLDANGFDDVKIHAFDNWPEDKFDFVDDMLHDAELQEAIDVIGGHVFYGQPDGHASAEVQRMAEQMGKPIWNTEDHVYLPGFDCEIGLVECFNDNYIRSGATKIVNWYDIGGVYPLEPYAEKPPMILAHAPWSGHYEVREALWGYAHYGQFSAVGWQYLDGGSGELEGGGSYVTLKSPGDDYSIIIETKDADAPQTIRFELTGGLSTDDLCAWRSNAQEQFTRLDDLQPDDGSVTLTLQPETIYSLSTTRGQQKGSFDPIPEAAPFPFPYYETFESYDDPARWGHLPRYTADIADVFELTERPDGKGRCLQQAIPARTISWAPAWQPYTIIGDATWHDYEVAADVYLNPGDTAGVMGRINHVGTGYGYIPKGYSLQLSDSGECALVVMRGKRDKKELVGDAEQQALIKAQNDAAEGGEKVLASTRLPDFEPQQWHRLTLRFEGKTITGLVDGKKVLHAEDYRYAEGMAGLLAAADEDGRLSTPYYDNLEIKPLGAPTPPPSAARSGQTPIYPR
ncbi:MAG: Galactosylceramidase [Puniceicoccaceae bacterium 5H]|nr:MAG: Galactosylceramidase [Puniceicoccaceae bacterium 5H]